MIITLKDKFSNTIDIFRRDFRIANKDDPCLCGIGDLGIAGYDHLCGNLAVLWSAEVNIRSIKH